MRGIDVTTPFLMFKAVYRHNDADICYFVLSEWVNFQELNSRV